MTLQLDAQPTWNLERTTDPARNNPSMPRRKPKKDRKHPSEIWRILHVEHSRFKAEAIWKKISGQFVCMQASPSIEDIVKSLRPIEAEAEMKSRGWKCSWT